MRFEEAPKIVLPSYYNQSSYNNKKFEEDKNYGQNKEGCKNILSIMIL